MAGKKQLPPVRVVQEGEKVAPQSYAESSERGTRIDELKALRRVLAAHIDSENTLARDLSPLVLRARELSEDIEDLEAREVSEGGVSTGDVADAEWRPQAI